MAGYSDDDSVGGYSDDQYSAGGYSDDQYSAGGYSDDDQHLEGGYSDDEQHAAVEDSDDDQDAPSGHCNNPVTTTKAHDYGGKQTITSNYGARQSEHSGFYQQTKKASYVNKQTGGYTCTTSKEVISTGNTFKERGPAGRVGTKNEYTTTDTWRVGDKNGYSEYWVQKGRLTVDYSGNSGSKSNYSGGSSKKVLK